MEDGELCKLLALQFPRARIICYEPAQSLIEEARENLTDLSQVHLCTDVLTIDDGEVDLTYCLEVFEHLPKAETEGALRQFNR